MIEIRNLCKKFGSFVAVDNVSFTVDKGEVLGFLGPNGAGKSTTMKMITGFLNPTGGTALVCGHDINTEPMLVKEKVGYLPEGAPAYPDMTPQGFLKFIGQIRGYSGAELRRKVDEAVAKTELESHLHQPIETLSKGFKRRVGLAQAILHDPPVLVMDEPTDGLDPNQKLHVRNLIQDMAKDKCIILSTHILEEVEAVCTRAVIIAAGKVIADGTPDELVARSAIHNSVIIRVEGTGEDDVRGKLKNLGGVDRVESLAATNGAVSFRVYPKDRRAIITEVGQYARDCGWKIGEIKVERGRLDDVFRDLTADATRKAGRET
ncbi:MAG: ATP-binding cassette domain-containing protein [Candidatus Sumerlaeia bacterium]|nr:ATP-binding cassette domain-containing protein [Candidatus Sumerlaeia bacterium]